MTSRSKWMWIIAGLLVVSLLWAASRRHGAGAAKEAEETKSLSQRPSPQPSPLKGEGVIGIGSEAAVEPGQTPEHEKGEEKTTGSRVSRSSTGDAVLTLDGETQERIGMHVDAVAAAAHQPTLIAYGTVMEDPAYSFVLRAPMTGIVRSAPQRPWPRLGEAVAGQETIGSVEPRLTSVEQLDMAARLAAARAEMSSATASLDAARTSYQSKKELRDQGNVVSERAVEEAETKVKTEEARLKAATDTVRLIEGLLGQQAEAATTKPLVLPRQGQVVEAPVQPDEAVESGQVVLRTVDLDHLIARVELPSGERAEGRIESARILVPGQEEGGLAVQPLGLAPTVGSKTLGQAFLLRVTAGDAAIRPGAAVIAYLALPGPSLAGVLIPRAAVVRYGGLAWVYVKTGDEQFARREVALVSPAEDGWFSDSGVSAGDEVVTAGAQMLLSEELKAQIEREEAAEE